MSKKDEYLKNKNAFKKIEEKNMIKSRHFNKRLFTSKMKFEEQNSRVEERLNRFNSARNK